MGPNQYQFAFDHNNGIKHGRNAVYRDGLYRRCGAHPRPALRLPLLHQDEGTRGAEGEAGCPAPPSATPQTGPREDPRAPHRGRDRTTATES